MKTKISISDFKFEFAGYGHYRVTYTSPVTGKKWTTVTDRMDVIDATENEEDPRVADLEALKKLCKN